MSVLLYEHAHHRVVRRTNSLCCLPEESAYVGRVGSCRQTLFSTLLWSTCLSNLSVETDKMQLTSENINKNFSKSYLLQFWENSSQMLLVILLFAVLNVLLSWALCVVQENQRAPYGITSKGSTWQRQAI